MKEWETSDIMRKRSKKCRDAKEEAGSSDGGLKTSPMGGHIKAKSWQWGAMKKGVLKPDSHQCFLNIHFRVPHQRPESKSLEADMIT